GCRAAPLRHARGMPALQARASGAGGRRCSTGCNRLQILRTAEPAGDGNCAGYASCTRRAEAGGSAGRERIFGRVDRQPAAMSSVGRRLLTTNSLITLQLLVGLANNIAIAAVFGLTRRVDAFYAALVLPSLFAGLFLDYLGRNFLPILAKAHKESDRLASELTSSVVTIVAVGSVGVVLVLVAASRPVFGVLLPGFAPEDVALVVHYFWIMAPAIALMA